MTTAPSRTIVTLELEPIAGSRFQPTGFPDLGAATFERAGAAGEQLLVESVQSMANHLEAATWDSSTNQPASNVAALPYVRVVDTEGAFLTSSRLEAHRLASAWILTSTIDGVAVGKAWSERFGVVKGERKPLDMRRIAAEVFKLDPVSLVHGVFFAQSSWAWQPKFARAVTCFIEASDVRPVMSGGVKRDSVVNTAAEGQSSREGFGMVPHQRTEYTADSIRLYAVIDEQQLASYGLSAAATELLSALAGWELAALLHRGLRLRTACDLVVAEASAEAIPPLETARQRLEVAVADVRDELAPTTEVVWSPGKGSRGKSDATDE